MHIPRQQLPLDLTRFTACVAYYGGNMFKAWSHDGPTTFEILPDLTATVQACFGRDDDNPSPADAERIENELTRLGVTHEFHHYEGAGHAFQNFCNPDRYRSEQAADAWDKTVTFLDQTLGG